MAYWQNGKCLRVWLEPEPDGDDPGPCPLHRRQAQRPCVYRGVLRRRFRLARARRTRSMAIPALLSRKINRPVMMRVSRSRGIRHRPGSRRFPGPDQGRLPRRWPPHRHADAYVVAENGANNGFWTFRMRPYAFGGVSADGNALARHPGAHQYAAPAAATRPGRKPDRPCVMEPMMDQGGPRARGSIGWQSARSMRPTTTARSGESESLHQLLPQ